MSETVSTDTTAVRIAIKDTAQRHEAITVPELAAEVAADCGCAEAAVIEAVDKLEQHGFVYLVPHSADASDQEVRVP